MAQAIELPDGLITIAELGVMAQYDDLETDEEQAKLADLIIRCTGVLIRGAAEQPGWTIGDLPYEAKVIALSFARRVFNNPQNQQRIQTGPLGESYDSAELTGLELKPSEEEKLATFAEGNTSGLGVISVVRSDPLAHAVNYDLGPLVDVNGQHYELHSMPSLSKFLGIGYGT